MEKPRSKSKQGTLEENIKTYYKAEVMKTVFAGTDIDKLLTGID